MTVRVHWPRVRWPFGIHTAQVLDIGGTYRPYSITASFTGQNLRFKYGGISSFMQLRVATFDPEQNKNI
jgi:hypothetical protein